MFLSTKLNMGAGSPAPAADPQFNYVTMLLHGDGTNGAQNNTFLDSSTNTFTITRNGNTTQGSFSPYGSNWSNSFAGTIGSPDYITIPSTTNLNLTGDYTVECWYLQNSSTNPTGYGLIFGTTLGAVGVTEVSFFIDYPGTGFNWGSLNSGVSPVAGTWYHLAATKSGSTTRIFVNGVLAASSTTADTPPSGVNWYIASRPTGSLGGVYSISGYVSNCRIVKGTALYTASFTPPTTPLTAVSGTQLLTCQSNRFVDNSANSYALTLTNSPKVQRFNPFGTSTAYSTSVIGGSGYFDGSGDSLTAPSNSAFAFGTGDFTIEAYVNFSVVGSNDGVLIELRSSGGTSNGFVFNCRPTAGGYLLNFYTSGSANVGSIVMPYNAWNHVAITRSGSTVRLFSNGAVSATITNSNNFSDTPTPEIGQSSLYSSSSVTGYISDMRLVKGTAVYTSAFTPPTAPLTAISGTSLLLSTINGAIYDNAMMNNLETLGNSQISTSVVKYGTGSMAFDGTGDWMLSTASQSIEFGNGDFTVEFWIYPSNWTNTYAGVIAGITNNSLWIGKNSSNFVLRAANNTDLVSYGTMPTTGTWTHIAVTRSGTTARMFYNGTQVASATTSNNFVNGAFYIGQDGGSNAFTGYLDDFRITKGYARYTANFTPPTAAFPNTGPV